MGIAGKTGDPWTAQVMQTEGKALHDEHYKHITM